MQRVTIGHYEEWESLLKKLRYTNYTNKQLNLSKNNLIDFHVCQLAEVLKFNKTIKSINLSWNFISSTGVKYLTQDGIKLVALDLHINSIGDAGADALIKANNVCHLDLSYNKIGPDGMRSIAENTRLDYLNLRSNLIGTEGAKLLARHQYIKHLDVVSNDIHDEGALALSHNRNMTTLILCSNPLVEQAHLGEVTDSIKTAIQLSEAWYFIHVKTDLDWNDRPLHVEQEAAKVDNPQPQTPCKSWFQSTLHFWKQLEKSEKEYKKEAKKENRLMHTYRYI